MGSINEAFRTNQWVLLNSLKHIFASTTTNDT